MIRIILDEVNEFLCSHVGVQFWSHFDWFNFTTVNDDDFADKVEKSLLKANTDLLIAKRGIMEQYEALCEENLIQANFSAPGVQRAIIRTLHHLETLWHLVVLPTPSVMLGVGVQEAPIRGGLWKKLFFSLFSTHFDRVFGNQDESTQEEDAIATTFESGFEDLVRQINALFLLEPLNDVLKAMICDKIQARISANMVGVFDAKDQLKEAQDWLSKSCLNFLAFVLSPDLERDQLELLLKEWEDERLKERERSHGEMEEESNFDFKSSTKRVASNAARSGGSAYPVRDMSSSIKRSKSSIGGSQRRGEESDDEFDIDFSSLLASSQPQFTPHAAKENHGSMKVGSRVTSPLGNVSRMSSPLRPSSPLMASKIPSSPIPLSASINGMSEWLKKNSFGKRSAIQSQTIEMSSKSLSSHQSQSMEISSFPSKGLSSSSSHTQSSSQPSSHIQSSPHHPLRLLSKWRAQLTCLLLELTLKLRISELFSLIVDYPNSLPALEDLRTCLNVTGQYGELVKSLRAAFAKRLMHPGATTADIVSIYISCIRAIKEIDPSTVLLSLVTVDLREYLRQRSDSLKNLVSLLSEDGGESGISLISDLEESASNSNNNLSQNEHDVDSDDENDLESIISHSLASNASTSSTSSSMPSSSTLSTSWNPSPIIRAPRFPSSSSSHGEPFSHHASSSHRGPKDIISMLIAIHGSKENFIAEYANLLALRLLTLSEFDTESEVKNVELMKLKFGEAQMLQCEVMLKDMAESKRANSNIHHSIKESLSKGLRVLPKKQSEDGEDEDDDDQPSPAIYNEEGVEISNVIFSHLYWPSSFQPLPVTLPEPWHSQRLAIEHQFSTLKSSRSLVWYDTMGLVELELSLKKETINGDGDASTNQLDELGLNEGDEMEINDSSSPSSLETKSFTVTPIQAAIIMLFEQQEEWECDAMVDALKLPSLEVLRRHASLWISNGIILEPEAGLFKLSDKLDMSDAIEEDGGLEMDDEEEENFDEFIPFIIAMLKNLGALPIAKIHQKMTNFNADYELTIQQLKELLEKMVSTEVLDASGGQYSIVSAKK